MQFDLTEEQQLIQQTARDFARRELLPRAAERDRTGEFPTRELAGLAKLGLLGICVPDELGGGAADPVSYSLAMQELGYADPSVAVQVSVTNMVAELIALRGTAQQAQLHVPPLVSGEKVCGAFALSEPEVGSDPASLRTGAERTARGWRLTGTKQWVTGGDHAGTIIVWAVSEPGKGHRGISAFIVPGDAAGLTVARREEKMGLCGSTTCQLVFDGVEVPEEALLGEPGQGFALAMMALDGGRIGIASQACGAARFALDTAIEYAKDRKTFGKPIIKHQAIGNMLSDCATWLDAAQLMVLRAAWLKGNALPFSQQAAMAKLYATEKASEICDVAIQVHGGYGYTRDYPVERAYRDVRVTRIYEGTSEIQRIVIARSLMKEVGL